MRWAAVFAVLLAQPAGWKPPAVRIQDEGEVQGYASTLNCVGAGISCSVGASVATVNVTGGGGGSATPGGINGNVQINSSGSLGAYTGTTCSYAVKSLDANGAAICTSAPTIPADISGAHYVTTQAEAGLSAEAVLPTCSGTDKLTFNGTTISCATDQMGSGAPVGATYITQTSDATLTNEQALSSLGTGLVKNTTGTGVLSIAAAGTDYQAPLTLPLSVANGGTNSSATATSGGVGYGTGTAHAYSAAGTSGQSLFSTGAGAPGWADAQKLVRLTSDYTNATTSMTNTALTWTSPAAVSRSAFICQLMVKASVTTIGAQVDVTSSIAPTTITYELFYVTGAGTPPSTAGAHSVIAATANSTALGPAAGLTTYTVWRLEGIIVHTSSASTVTIRAKASGSGTVTIGSGSNCQYSSL